MSTFSYNASIPQATDNPSVSQGQFLTNFSSTSQLVAVDHIGFNTSGGGRHNQVTFGANNPPAGTVTPPVLFTNTQDGAGNNLPGSLAQLFFYSGTPTQGQNNYVSTSSGSVMLMGGIILKWGVINFTTSSKSVSFGVSFPNALWSVVLSADTTTPSGNGIVSFASPSVSGFTAYQNGSSTLTAYYIAIGN